MMNKGNDYNFQNIIVLNLILRSNVGKQIWNFN
jgi:hypothetical protein